MLTRASYVRIQARKLTQSAPIWVLLMVAVAWPAMAEELDWIPVPESPRFEVKYRQEPEFCREIEQNPDQEVMDCWAERVTKNAEASYRDQSDSGRGSVFACFSEWEYAEAVPEALSDQKPRQGKPCFGEKGRCTRPKLRSGFEKPAKGIPGYRELFSVVKKLTEEMGQAYTDFHYLRRGKGRNRFNSLLGALAVKQGLLVLYQGQGILVLKQELVKAACWVSALDDHLVGIEKVMSEVSTIGLKSSLKVYPKKGQVQERKLYELQRTILSPPGSQEQDNWADMCQEVAVEKKGEVNVYLSDLNAWCGYAYRRAGDVESSDAFLNRAKSGIHHPGPVNYANKLLQREKPVAVVPASSGDDTK